MDCPFCDGEEMARRIIVDNDLAFAFPTRTPIVPGHILICPKRHVQYYEDATQEEKIAIEELRHKLKNALKIAFDAKGFNYAWNEEKIGGQSVPHFHLHVVPRKEGDEGVHRYEPREFLYRPSPRTAVASGEELRGVVEALKNAL